MPWFKKEYHSYIYIFGLLLLAASLTLSQILMSIAQFILFFNWLAERDFIEKYNKIKKNKAVLAFLIIYAIHVAGLFYSYNLRFALEDLRVKLPLLILPIIIATSPQINRKTLVSILLVHVAATFISTVVGVYVFFSTQISNVREISIFISHIRLSLNICLDILVLSILLLSRNNFKLPNRIGAVLLIIWFVFFLFFLEALNGIIILSVVSFILLILYLLRENPLRYKIILSGSLVVLGVLFSLAIIGIYNDYNNKVEVIDPIKLSTHTKHGGLYQHDFNNKEVENGNYTWMYVCDEELRNSWNRRSNIKYDSADKLNQSIKYTLIRFLTSKGLLKDMDGVNSLTDYEVSLIEDGVANVEFAKKGSFTTRLKKLIWEYENYNATGDPRGKSMMQRFELWKSSVQLVEKYPLIGVGTGDPADAFAAQLDLEGSLLKDSNLRSHNQYLTITIAFGTIGLFLFLFGLIYPGIKLNLFSDLLYLSFFMIAAISMLSEDTLETQAGVTFFTFFNCLFLFAYKKGNPD